MMGKRLFMAVALAAVTLAIGPVGCRSLRSRIAESEEGDPSPLPWNAPASWEGKTIGIPY